MKVCKINKLIRHDWYFDGEVTRGETTLRNKYLEIFQNILLNIYVKIFDKCLTIIPDEKRMH